MMLFQGLGLIVNDYMQHIPQPNTAEELEAVIESLALRRLIEMEAHGRLFLCGQCCIAMVASTTLQEAIIACGQIGATLGADLMRALRVFEISHKWRRFKPNRVPDECLIHLIGERDTSHWVYRYYDFIYNPAEKRPIPINSFDLSRADQLIEIR
jgi:hypothetical protein